MKSKQELKKVFENGDKPTQEDFWEWQDSYWHKEEKIPISQINGYGISNFKEGENYKKYDLVAFEGGIYRSEVDDNKRNIVLDSSWKKITIPEDIRYILYSKIGVEPFIPLENVNAGDNVVFIPEDELINNDIYFCQNIHNDYLAGQPLPINIDSDLFYKCIPFENRIITDSNYCENILASPYSSNFYKRDNDDNLIFYTLISCPATENFEKILNPDWKLLSEINKTKYAVNEELNIGIYDGRTLYRTVIERDITEMETSVDLIHLSIDKIINYDALFLNVHKGQRIYSKGGVILNSDFVDGKYEIYGKFIQNIYLMEWDKLIIINNHSYINSEGQEIIEPNETGKTSVRVILEYTKNED